jgi:invasin B
MSMSPLQNPTQGPISQEIPFSSEEVVSKIAESGPIPQWAQRDSTITNWIASSMVYIHKNHYESTSADHPKLPSPVEGGTQASAVEPAVQDIVRGFIAKEIMILLAPVRSPEDQNEIFNHLTTGEPLKNPQLEKIANQIKEQVEARVKQEARLNNFTLSALHQPNKEAWIQTPLAPYSAQKKEEISNFFNQARNEQLTQLVQSPTSQLTAKQVESLNLALAGGKIEPSIRPILEQIDAAAISETQKIYHLPTSWTPNTTEVSNWKPVNAGIVTPTTVAEARHSRITQNVETLEEGFYQAIMDAIWNFREQLEKSQAQIAEDMLTNLDTQKVNQEARAAASEEQRTEMLKAQKKQDILGGLGLAMKIIGPILSALAIAGSIAMIAITGGAATPLAVAGIAVGVAMLTYSVVESATGVTSEAISVVKDFMTEVLEDVPEALVPFIQAAAIIAVIAAVALLFAATAATGQVGAAANVATRTIAQFLTQAAVVAARQIAVQTAVILIMSSGLLMEIPRNLADVFGMDEKSSDIFTYLMFALSTLSIIALAAFGAKSAGGSSATTANPLEPSTLQKAARGAKALATNTQETLEDIGKTLANLAKSSATRVKNLPQDIANMPANLKSFANKNWELAKLIYNNDTSAGPDPLKNALAKWEKIAIPFNRAAQMAQPAATIPSAAVQGVVQFQLANITIDMAELKKTYDDIEALLTVLDSLMSKLQSAMSGTGESIQNITATIDDMMRAADKNVETASYIQA